MTNNTKCCTKSRTIATTATTTSNDQNKEQLSLTDEFAPMSSTSSSSSSSSSAASSSSSTSSSPAAAKTKSKTAKPEPSIAPACSGEPSGTQEQQSSQHASQQHQHHQQQQQQQQQQPGNLHITSQTYKIITQYGDMLVIKQSLHNSSHHHHHHHHHQQQHPLLHHHASLASATQSTASGHMGSGMMSCAEAQQQPNRPIIMTFHDLGLNSELQFAPFFECHEVKLLLQTFTIMHVNFIGQEFEHNPETGMPQPCESLPDDFKYPTVEQLAECIVDVCAQMRIRSFVALAVGAGAHIVSTLALIRPDLVHGLFLINPVVVSCSITEWLYFKMSAIASNHQTASQSAAAAAAASSGAGHGNDAASSCSTSDHSTVDDDQQAVGGSSGSAAAALVKSHQQSKHSSSHHHHGETGLRRLLHAMHLPHKHHNHHNHHHHHHHHYHHHHHHSRTHHNSGGGGSSSKSHRSNDDADNSSGNTTCERVSDESGVAELARTTSISSSCAPAGSPVGPGSVSCSPEPGATSTTSAPSIAHPASSRLRQMILSRNFRMAGAQAASKHKQQQQQQQLSDDSAPASRKSSESPSSTSAVARTASRPNFHHAHQHHHPQHKRAPIEYLMYHHFGSSAFRRVRRPSDTPPSSAHGAGESPSAGGGVGGGSSATGNDSSGGHSSPATRSLDSANQRADSMSLHATTNTDGSSDGAARPRYQRTRRSNSICLSASYLASFSSERQRINYIQSVYKQYFNQINTHNLWLFAQSFAKRRALNLRKDCGAAAHAAAAAAALGTSICAAFIAAQPPPPPPGGAITSGASSSIVTSTAAQNRPTTTAAAAASEPATTVGDTGTGSGTGVSGGGDSSVTAGSDAGMTRLAAMATKHAREHSSGSPKANPLASGSSNSSNTGNSGHNSNIQVASVGKQSISTNNNQLQQHLQQQQQEQQTPLVAGTKVKRTFTCQTLIMCSSVQMHCERALKLMSLLNPLQATWIKIDHLLVLEERPDKVCQVLRLFLQGIGYSMSTYERRLRLNSAHASASSADSSSSIRSLNDKSGG